MFDGSLYEFYRLLNVRLDTLITDDDIHSWASIVINASHLSVTPGKYDLETIVEAYKEVREHFAEIKISVIGIVLFFSTINTYGVLTTSFRFIE